MYDKPLEFSWHQSTFFHWKLATLVTSRNVDKHCILIQNLYFFLNNFLVFKGWFNKSSYNFDNFGKSGYS